MSIPRNEYPRPMLVRENWKNLNGEWDFEIDNALCGKERHFFECPSLESKIVVPFCPESKLSGVNHKDFMNCVWYRKSFEIPGEWRGKRVVLHFGAVDYKTTVYVNCREVMTHVGGYTPFCADITDFLHERDNFIAVCAEDDVRGSNQPTGKQSDRIDSYGCFYTRTTGIWQTVWLEAYDKAHIENVKYISNIETGEILAQVSVSPECIGGEISFETFFEGEPTGSLKTKISCNQVNLTLKLSKLHLWDIGKGNLYDAKLSVSKDGEEKDTVESYFGMRSVALSKNAFYLNGRRIFSRLALDQGYYPDGVYTAPDDSWFVKDIENAVKLGFNGVRLHEKVFEPRYLYHADKLGFLVWGEHGTWGLDITDPASLAVVLPEWLDVLERDFSHPSIVCWVPFNETWWDELMGKGTKQCAEILSSIYRVTKSVDKTRPCIDTSGDYHVITDIFDVHDYEQDPKLFYDYYKDAKDGIVHDAVFRQTQNEKQMYRGEPLFMSEYGGIRWSSNPEGWGYGTAPKTEEEYLERYKGLTDVILDNEAFTGFCYTQLYDVEQEENGLMTYDREFKFPPEIFFEINSRKAKNED